MNDQIKLIIPEIEKYPAKVSKPYLEIEGSNDPLAVHKSLLDLGEGLLDYLVAFMFGEYKRSGKIDDSLEAEFYKHSGRNISAGVKAGFLRRLTKIPEDSVIAKKIHAGTSYEKAGHFAQTYDLLKQITGEGIDSGFADKLKSLRKGRTAKKLDLNDFYNYFIQIRNIFAHPENKAGPKSSPRDWPLNEDYFAVINHELRHALVEIIVDFEIIKSFTPVFVNSIDSSQKNATVAIQRSGKPGNQTIDLSQDDLEEIMSEEHYILNNTNALYAKLYLSKIPSLNPEVAEKIIRSEKSKIEEPRLKESIDHMLGDGAIDHLEYFALKDTATRAFISEDRLKELITERKNKKGIDKPLEEILVETKEVESRAMFNPWWLKYFGMLDIIDGNKVKEQRKESKANEEKIKELEEKKKRLPVQKKIDKFEIELGEKEKQLKKCKEEEKTKILTTEIDQLKSMIQELESSKNDKCADINEKIEKIEIQEGTSLSKSQWSVHKTLWNELTEYFQCLVDEHLNANISKDSDEGNAAARWVVKPNEWQMGSLTHYYWGKIYKEDSILGVGAHMAIFMDRNKRRLGNIILKSSSTSVDFKIRSISPGISVNCECDWKVLSAIDIDRSLIKKYITLLENLRDENIDSFKKLGAWFFTEDAIHSMRDYDLFKEKIATWRSIRPEPEENALHREIWRYSSVEDNPTRERIASPRWNIEDFMEGNNISRDKINVIEKEMVTYIKVFSNVLNDLNEYALGIGINEEHIKKCDQQIARAKILLFEEAEKYLIDGELQLGAEGNQRLREIAREHGIGPALLGGVLDKIRGKFREDLESESFEN